MCVGFSFVRTGIALATILEIRKTGLSRNSAFDSPCLVKHAFNLQIPIQSHRSELHKPVKPLLHAGLKPIPWSDVMDEAQRQ